MDNRRISNVSDVVRWRLCLGCGACVNVCPENNIRLVDVLDQGIRPYVELTKCKRCGECIKVCPGVEIKSAPANNQLISELRQAWGPVIEIWEGYATDPEIRFKGSSGGVATALSLFCLEKRGTSGVLHTGVDLENPLRNVPVFSKNREGLLACTGSRYSPAAPCEKIRWIQEADSPCVFVGKPCDVAALRKSQAVNPELNEKVGLAISIFCAGTPSTAGTYAILNSIGVDASEVKALRYRGNGWPGATVAKVKGKDGKKLEMRYEKSWGEILSKHIQTRCRFCPDTTGEFADISCGDPWYREIEPDDPGWSLVLVRTERGRRTLRNAMEAGYVEVERVLPAVLPTSQQALLNKRQNLFGRLLAMRLTLTPAPRYSGFSLTANWRSLSAAGKIYSLLGTFYRVFTRGWHSPLECFADRDTQGLESKDVGTAGGGPI